ncbi:unnamed protein product [Owenia fusiformis]|uniref:Fibrinogen C-terminal domain-containing protein n=1 Tax=Owenia fusiformis TaxID=6347 RepID=A0A8S4N1B6_OWEFU|nr:unnamed protein product [Owenia fusiformis]
MMNVLTILIWLVCFYITLFCDKANTDKRGSFNNSGYSTKYYHEIGYIYTQPPMKTSVMSMAAYDMEIAAVQCLFTCQKENSAENLNCVAVNFNSENGTCQLLSNQPVYKYDECVVSDDHWTLYMEEPIKFPRDCEDIRKRTLDQYYEIQPDLDKPPFSVLCGIGPSMATYIQSHKSSSHFDFQNATWAQYRDGFRVYPPGLSYYWIGNENLHTLTSSRDYTIDFLCRVNRTFSLFILYSSILVGSEADFYRLNIGTCAYRTRDILNDAIWVTANDEAKINGSVFLTHENVTENACARQGGWWYNNCTNANFNTANGNMFWGSYDCSYGKIRVLRKKP